MTTEALPYQRAGVAKIQRFGGRALLADDPGLGKTFQFLKWAKVWMRAKGPVVVLCPATLKENWEWEAMHHVGVRVTIADTRTPPRGRLVPKDGWYVMNPELLDRKGSAWLRFFHRLRPACVCVDEGQMFRHENRRVANLRKLCHNVPHVVVMSGTGCMENGPAELWPVLNVLRPDVFRNKRKFLMAFCNPQFKPWGWRFEGVTPGKGPKLRKLLLRTCMIRRRKQDVIDQLPVQKKKVVLLTLGPGRMREYQEAEDDFIRWLRKTHPNRVNRARKAERLQRVLYLKRLVGELKVRFAEKWVRRRLPAEKVLVFGEHRNVLGPLRKAFGRGAAFIDGSISNRRPRRGGPSPRRLAADRFNKVPSVRVMLANKRAAGAGWNCTATNTVLFVEIGWTPGEHTQAAARVYGLNRGTGGQTTCYFLVAKGTIDERLVKVVDSKQAGMDAILDGKKGPDGMNILDELEDALLRRGVSSKRRGR